MTQNHSSDHFKWLDDLIRRWPVILGALVLVGWLTGMQFKQEAMAKDISEYSVIYPNLAVKVDAINSKLDAVIEALGYDVRVRAIKKENI